jgi:Lipase (class 3)
MIGARAAVLAASATYSGIAPTWHGAGFINQTIRAYKSRVNGRAVVAFEGSKTWQNWFNNLLAVSVPLRDHPECGRVHAGFDWAARSIAAAIGDLNEDYDIVGHSLGGALAVYVPMLLKRRPGGIYAFAPAAVFADVIPDWILELVVTFGGAWRFGNDPVPLLPPWFPQVPLTPVGRATADPKDSHHIENYVAALAP